jgi:hypothetical protein
LLIVNKNIVFLQKTILKKWWGGDHHDKKYDEKK